MKRPYRISAFIEKGEIGEGGLSFAIGARYATEEAAIARVRRYIGERWDLPPDRYLICRHAGEACWVTSEGEVVRRDLEGLSVAERCWGYAS